jgi:16S rRNA A1518/A1519 N6-dimethyltransferase RsmA/KsgA/DIM1 with predicted DNA glycosylase/AP lyase activity
MTVRQSAPPPRIPRSPRAAGQEELRPAFPAGPERHAKDRASRRSVRRPRRHRGRPRPRRPDPRHSGERRRSRSTLVEKDPRFVPLLQELDAGDGRLTIVQADALKVDEATLAEGPTHLVSNLPYNVGTPLLIKWLTGPWTPCALTLMFQKEVAERIVADTDDDAYGRLAVISQAVAEARIVMHLPAAAFTPPPKVASAVVHLIPRADRPDRATLKRLETVTAAAFGQRRKMLRSSLKHSSAAAPCAKRPESIPTRGRRRSTWRASCGWPTYCRRGPDDRHRTLPRHHHQPHRPRPEGRGARRDSYGIRPALDRRACRRHRRGASGAGRRRHGILGEHAAEGAHRPAVSGPLRRRGRSGSAAADLRRLSRSRPGPVVAVPGRATGSRWPGPAMSPIAIR